MTFVREAILRIAAADDQRHHHVAVLPARHVRAECDNFAGDFKTRNIRGAWRRRVKAHALHDVRPVDACGRDFDQYLASRGLGYRSQFRREYFWAAGFADGYDGHPLRQWYRGHACWSLQR
jgi:hypothetical protein